MPLKYDLPKLLEQARQNSVMLKGFYNENYPIDIDGKKYIIRTPIEGAESMDIKGLPENEVLKLIAQHDTQAPVPKVIAEDIANNISLHSFIDGVLVNNEYPRGKDLPEHFINDTIAMKALTYELSVDSLRQYVPTDWPQGDYSNGIFQAAFDKLQEIYTHFYPKYSELYRMLYIPIDPLETLRRNLNSFTPRPLKVCHCDIHRKNAIINEGKTYFLDWECSLIADPVYDIAVHMHKMQYSPLENRRFMKLAKRKLPADTIKNMDEDLPKYIELERAKSAIVDTIRIHSVIHDPQLNDEEKQHQAQMYNRKMIWVEDIWHIPPRPSEEILQIMRQFKL